MAKGAKRKTKWVSLSLANANTKTSNATGSDSEQTQVHHHQQQHHGEGHRHKMHNGATSLAAKVGKEFAPRTDVIIEEQQQQHQQKEMQGNERVQEQSGNRTDTSTGSDCVAGSERRPIGSYHRRRPPPYNNSRTSWSGGAASTGSNNGRSGHYHRNGYYGNGGGYYGAGKRSHYEHYPRRQQPSASTNRTTSGEGGETGGTTINDDEYTRITTPRQDVLFKKGYLSRPKPSVATASTSNTGSSSIAATTSEGSDGGNGGSNSISTTESITSEYGGSYAADGSQLIDYSYPCIPCGYFTETGVLVMNGFAVDNNGFSYFNGGQTYIYPPNYNNCQPSPPTDTTSAGDQTTDSMLYANDNATDETNANESTDLLDGSSPNHAPPVGDVEAVAQYDSNTAAVVAYGECGDTAGDGQFYANGALPTLEQVPEEIIPNGEPQLAGELMAADAAAAATAAGAVCDVQEPQDYSENGFFPYTNGYDFAQFYNSLCYPNWFMEQCRMYDDAGLPLYCGGEYAMTNEEVYGHQPSFKKRKKRFRTFEEMPAVNGNSYDVGNATSAMMLEPNATGSETTECVPESQVPSKDAPLQSYQLNADVQEFQPAALPVANSLPNAAKIGDVCTTSNDKVVHHSTKPGNAQPVARSRHPVAPKASKSTSKVVAAVPAAAQAAVTSESATAPNSSPVPVGGKPTSSKANRKKDLIESTLAFAAQNIDLTRPKAAASVSHESDLCWSTIDRNGRKKRVASELPEQDAVTAPGAEKESAAEERANTKHTNGDTVQPVAPTQAAPTTVECSTVPDANGNREQPTKSKKKTHKHKRQQLRKSVGNFSKQPLEGFQLIEPEFSSSAAGHRRGRSGDKAGRAETITPKASNEEATQNVEVSNEKQPSSVSDGLEQETASCEGASRVIEEVAEVATTDVYCDKESDGVPAEVSPTEENVALEVEELIAQKVIPSLAVAVAVEEKTNLNETETEMHHQQTMSVDVEQLEDKEQEPEVEVIAEGVIEESKNDSKSVAQEPEAVEEVFNHVAEGDVEILQEPTELDSTLCVEELIVPHDLDESSAVLSLPVEQHQTMDVQLTIDTHVLTSAAKQLTISSVSSPKLPTLEEDETEEQADGADDGIGSEGDDARPKRGSVSGAGYTESIDSGLQSPAPCGGVASPETSSMVSSIESQPASGESSQSALTQVVGSWLLRKLEVHETEELFVLPSNPLLIQRLERFHQLQRRERRERLRGVITSESEGDEEEEYDLEGEDTDSDYMSDGQGRLDRTQSDDANSSQPGSPLNSTQQEGADAAPKTLPDDAGTLLVGLDEGKRQAPAVHANGEHKSAAMVHRAADSKRCSIM
uniref:Uncharacterized protein n=2 Tax=Anopheles coluzzii TaxID=1518534 RepID=A0A6E8WBR8_ANOCL|nr:uncharacterized protein LOC120957223 isoform X1 [Anopheles coluzzii]XP_040235235.2 uncharacterized protein LOC120957223 isoform X1 [Anopheles coluzzii]XP_040235236.2 uncharacterized protein LOC120957223 isoform X1 [Anopheles coluzzii]XP_040235237.2 uncharacterized protein LOC120957223 isoform X1 [Anopheles coluzzii]XP_040235238.2 uncharacterized protein LOC120957223 isoform X1 [Anopheles coluzzii]XP_040235239.2 uncharacterized protein LOC120957223 isoform X1 [Anopheles coluzzii]